MASAAKAQSLESPVIDPTPLSVVRMTPPVEATLRILLNSVPFLIGFFFQAEDGIRDLTVTGVQTCALPICDRDQLDENFGGALVALERLQDFLGAVAIPALVGLAFAGEALHSLHEVPHLARADRKSVV